MSISSNDENVDNVVSVSDVSQTGTWSYYSGVSGTVTVLSTQRVIGIGAHSAVGGSITINGGTSVPIPAGVGIGIEPHGNLVSPTIVFVETDSYFVEVLS